MKSIFLTLAFFVIGTATNAQTTILIVYHSETGNTEQMAMAVYEGVSSVEGIEVVMRSVTEAGEADLLNAVVSPRFVQT